MSGIIRRTKFRIWYSIILIVLGIASLYVGIFADLTTGNADYSSGFYVGLGCALIVASIITIIKKIRLLKDEEALKKQEIYENDERNKLIGLKTWSYAGYTMFILLYVAMLVTAAIDVMIMNTLLVVIATFALCLFVVGIVLKKKM